ncbi:MAG: DNA-directed RNA polymerase subunit alpha [Candidatus Nealsonbacteria bacterium CG23_combo_of_CG06-09_8_20_14_all_40_13]|uniref:DNA-directed RNA polymerase subunit alpha n=1 Tax=Candidatus Nealsonbacteria bacterium CG23_combo_of_CG06-09_8_20_14_all_40_13 TaxID=1974724 RepID=A0A2G9YQX9_9BACT|nr:MAG: DNA-directed RNA polymerase subunit alpha [Candidatus Nealsonbacteria bacterium CG23_combo_of_CG06-09_8_20_14_all_40_13]PIR71238.1 MAG: DNA-directed RNA polymerase subunit alpha [Candidatus Nealsonbacteria bacterium CG10_big_fil_rev_8_21_14_0_10_40_24]PIU43323.1 MAG: DNA-directed RNA polymerase subunit alpha [Candidatus Nealsonbacteria bacterium CG07_land_8_20_14_0_80_40_10]
MSYTLPETELLKFQTLEESKDFGIFVLEPLFPGYGITIGTAIRRILLSSLEGAAISSVKFDNASHEFSTLKGVKEDMVEIILNLKSLRLTLNGTQPTVIKLAKKGVGEVTAEDIVKNAQVELIDPTFHIATLDKDGKLSFEATVEKGRGYVPAEIRKEEKLPLGTIAIDCVFSPIRKVHFEIDNTRVAEATNFDKLTMEITTDGTIKPSDALKIACQILLEHFNFLTSEIKPVPVKAVKETKAKNKKVRKPKKMKLHRQESTVSSPLSAEQNPPKQKTSIPLSGNRGLLRRRLKKTTKVVKNLKK